MDNYRRLLSPPRGSFFLFGVRGAGKSTWVRESLDRAYVIDLLDETRYQALTAAPGALAAEIAALPPGRVIVIDEVQRIPALLNEVHRAIESSRRRFALLGSSARRLKSAGTNLLAGRASVKTMFPLVPAELGGDFNLERVLTFGSVPIVWRADDSRATLEAYVHLYIREEIRAEAQIRNLPGFLRFLPVAALCHGQVVNISGVARDAATSRPTIDGYLGLLEDTLVATRLPALEQKLRVRERKHPKLYWVDPGLVRAAKKQLGPLTAEERGPLFEGWIFTLLRAHHEVSRLWDEIGYWAPLNARQIEVDFLLRRGRDHLAIEVKTTRRVDRIDRTGLAAVAEVPRMRRRILVYLGTQQLTVEGIDVWPLATFLEALAADRLWP
jgi:predicted AAA+ superfamily ATPase